MKTQTAPARPDHGPEPRTEDEREQRYAARVAAALVSWGHSADVALEMADLYLAAARASGGRLILAERL